MSLTNKDYKDFDQLCKLSDNELVAMWRDFYECRHNYNYMSGDTRQRQKLELNRAIVKRWTDQADETAQNNKPMRDMLEGFRHALKHARQARDEITKAQSRVAHGAPVKNAIKKAMTAYAHAISELEYCRKDDAKRIILK